VSAAGQTRKLLLSERIEDGSRKLGIACGKLKSTSACEASINDVAGADSEQEQATALRVWMAAEAFFGWDSIRIGAPCFIIEHVMPLCIQQREVQADCHEAAVPFTMRNAWKEPHKPTATSSAPKNLLITIY